MMKEMTVKRKLKRPEILAPAGTLEKLKTAIHYGADAVYIGGNAYGLRSRAGNFTYEEMAEGVAFAKEHDAKVYIYPLKLQQLILRHWNSGKKKGWNVSF